jgi:acetyl-CoA carboxylase biotin carboxylase subunit
MIRRVLIANRGEIAVRVARTCREMGLSTVAVYSEADADAPHVAAADDAVPIGPPPAAESYLDIARILDAAKHTGADAIHPGYGFLSENADFAAACEAAGVTFVGPSASVIRRMGSKTAARETVRAAGVPVVPGEAPQAQSPDVIRAAVKAMGLPVILKAVAGGGGKGMRVVRTPAEVADAVDAASREALRAFGNGTLYVERLIDAPRHVEVQIFGDTRGRVVHLFERDCTLQRRHQKVLEEAPASNLPPGVREKMLAAAVQAARTVGYVNAGTVEFLVEGEGDGTQFYFLEMNTRLQVEHPVTEAITGIDMVRAQLEVAGGEPLSFGQADVVVRGHAIEGRVYAEDSARLLPQSGRLLRYREPEGPGVRVDSGVREGQRITVHYDPLLAKVIAHGASRDEALGRLAGALERFEILGLHHNLSFLLAVLARPEIRAMAYHTGFIEAHLADLAGGPPDDVRRAAAAIAAFLAGAEPTPARVSAAPGGAPDGAPPGVDPWDPPGPLRW